MNKTLKKEHSHANLGKIKIKIDLDCFMNGLENYKVLVMTTNTHT